MFAYSTAIVLADVSIPQPDPSKLPGGDAFMGLVSGLLAFALIAAVAGIAISAITWAFGSHNSNPHIASRGKVAIPAARETLWGAISLLFL
jgi:Na+-transporting methylmalonyl-CoA/oxaloacetate decarboxylase beta subunit